MNFPLLSSLILLPTIGALFIFFTRSSEKNNNTVKYVALFTSIVNFFLSIYLWVVFDQTTSEFQFVEDRVWIENFINYKFNENGNVINLFFDKKTFNLIGWQTIDIYQNISITYLSSIKNSFLLNPKRVWVHTCSLDHKNALNNYIARGMKIFKTETVFL